MKRKQLKKGLDQLSEEGVIQIYQQPGFGERDPILGAVGALQFEVLEHRLLREYNVSVRIERLSYSHARWIICSEDSLRPFTIRQDCRLVYDRDNLPVILFTSDWSLKWAQETYKDCKFESSH